MIFFEVFTVLQIGRSPRVMPMRLYELRSRLSVSLEFSVLALLNRFMSKYLQPFQRHAS